MPKSATEEPANKKYNNLFAEVVGCAQKVIRNSEHVAHVEVTDSAAGCSIIIRPCGDNDGDWQTELVLTTAKEALMDAASKSKNCFLLGYCSPKPFTHKPLGFEATLGIMESPTTACWHKFKKGFCRHGAECCKQHPPAELQINVLVESVQFNSCTRFITSYKQEVADLAMAVMATLQECSYADQVEAVKDSDCQGWTIEVMPKEELNPHKEYLLNVAKSALFSASDASNTLYIMGYAAMPFISKSQGFIAVLGDMQDESRACWDFYTKGVCSRECGCRWEHPECLMPINVVIKKRGSLKGLNAALERLAADGLSTTAR